MFRAILMGLWFFAVISTVRAEILDGDRIVVVDGDTVALPCASPAPGCSEKLRFYAIDAPESYKPRCEAEMALALQTKETLRGLLTGQILVMRGDPQTRRTSDPYGRTLGTLIRIDDASGAPRGDVQRVLLDRGLALPYAAGALAKEQRRAYWCG